MEHTISNDVYDITPTNEEIQKYMTGQSDCGLEKCDVVKIIRKAVQHEQGWPNNWVTSMDKFVGTTAIVKELNRYGISLCGNKEINGFGFPFFVLEKVVEE